METATASKFDSFSVTNDGEIRIIEVFELHLRTATGKAHSYTKSRVSFEGRYLYPLDMRRCSDWIDQSDLKDDNLSCVLSLTLSFHDATVYLSSFGATIIKFLSESNNNDNDTVDIVAGYKDAETFHNTGNPPFFNSIVGRVTNRIAGGKFSLGKKSYSIFANDPPNCLHGGKVGVSHKIWDASVIGDGTSVRFSLESPDGDQGFPGSVTITATYSLRPSFSSSGVILQLDMNAELVSKGDYEKGGIKIETPINLANHSYFNLGDHQNGILDHSLRLESDSYAPVDEHCIPTREVRPLWKDPAMDFRTDRSLRDALENFGVVKLGLTEEQSKHNLAQREYSSIPNPYGFDHNYVVRKQPGTSLPIVGSVAYGPRNLVVYSDAPGVQVYTANKLGDSKESSSAELCKQAYRPWDAICLETQHFPDSICRKKDTPKGNREFWAGRCPILSESNPTYHQTMVLRLEVDQASAREAYRGSDTDGRTLSSIEEMWKAQELSTWYTRAKGWYEDNCDTTIDGVLGGIGHISGKDLEGSHSFLNELELPSMPENKASVACECGAGIGRVTKGLLLDFADRCDLVESSSRLLFSAPDHIGDSQSHRCRFFCTELQDWVPGSNKYSIIWIQWTLCYLTDFDTVRFLRRCSKGLVDGGWIILKENTCAEEAFVVDVDDASITRSLEYWLDLIAKSGLQVKRLKYQDDFPDDIFPVPMLALQNNV
jgi:galactose mutarotase-like enzyme